MLKLTTSLILPGEISQVLVPRLLYFQLWCCEASQLYTATFRVRFFGTLRTGWAASQSVNKTLLVLQLPMECLA